MGRLSFYGKTRIINMKIFNIMPNIKSAQIIRQLFKENKFPCVLSITCQYIDIGKGLMPGYFHKLENVFAEH